MKLVVAQADFPHFRSQLRQKINGDPTLESQDKKKEGGGGGGKGKKIRKERGQGTRKNRTYRGGASKRLHSLFHTASVRHTHLRLGQFPYTVNMKIACLTDAKSFCFNHLHVLPVV